MNSSRCKNLLFSCYNCIKVITLNIENEVFKRSNVDFKKMEKYGFKKENNKYIFEKNFLNNNFKAIIMINDKGIVSGKVMDLQVDEEYTNIRTEMSGEFVNKVREEYKCILQDVKNNCFEAKFFLYNQTNKISKYIKDKYNVEPEFLWKKYPFFGIFRNKNNDKWFALITNVDKSKIDNGSGEVELLNIKLDEDKIKLLLRKKGFYKAYHMNKINWISIILNDTLSDEEIYSLIDDSYDLIEKSK